MSNNKMKGLLKGLRYISQIFASCRSCFDLVQINEYKSPPGFSSAPLSLPEDIGENNVRRDTRATNSLARDLPELPRSSRRQSSAIGVVTDQSPTKEKSEKSKQSRRSSKSSINKDSLDGTKPTRSATRQPLDPNNLGDVSPAHSLPDIPKKARRKKVKEYSHGSTMLARSSRLKPQASPGGYQSPFSVETYQSPFSDPGPGSGSLSTSKNNELYPQSFEDQGQQKGFPGIY
ncbi:CRIB domain-containing protein RIC7-like [Juglans microcarpa x Juglans regia]|uniref:CRIB domain-containing protein RIC7-like n=1 Tax=Juglans microcarpa x Juglans regia TaxID=2249226 RepID=UPI001B7EBF7A|nr:CRIB domain-containing protein RIC7-like [Juglans microcarpa x Juglans regia]